MFLVVGSAGRLSACATRYVVLPMHRDSLLTLPPQISFFFGVMNVLCSALLLGFAPTYIPLYYSVQMAGFLPLRIYAYKKRLYH